MHKNNSAVALQSSVSVVRQLKQEPLRNIAISLIETFVTSNSQMDHEKYDMLLHPDPELHSIAASLSHDTLSISRCDDIAPSFLGVTKLQMMASLVVTHNLLPSKHS